MAIKESGKANKWKAIVTLGISFVFLIAIVLADSYSQIVNLGARGDLVIYPYRMYVVPLAIGCILSFIIAISYSISGKSKGKTKHRTKFHVKLSTVWGSLPSKKPTRDITIFIGGWCLPLMVRFL